MGMEEPGNEKKTVPTLTICGGCSDLAWRVHLTTQWYLRKLNRPQCRTMLLLLVYNPIFANLGLRQQRWPGVHSHLPLSTRWEVRSAKSSAYLKSLAILRVPCAVSSNTPLAVSPGCNIAKSSAILGLFNVQHFLLLIYPSSSRFLPP